MSHECKINFLYASIADTQATIRAIDIKIGFLFVINFIPLSGLSSFTPIYKSFIETSVFFNGLFLILILLWTLSTILLLKTLISISDPSKHIAGNFPSGVFYSGGLYKFGTVDKFLNFPIESNVSIDSFINLLPTSETDIINELSFEIMKLTYIRDIKIKRSSLCVRLIFFWIMLGVLTWITYITGIS